MINSTVEISKEQSSPNFHSINFPLIVNERKFSKLMKDFKEAFEMIGTDSSANSFLFNPHYFKDFFQEINKAQDKINKLQSLFENHAAKIASIFLCIQKNATYTPILQNLFDSKNKCISFINSEIQNRQNKIDSMKCDSNCYSKKLKELKDEINSLKSNKLFLIHEELMQINDLSIENAHQCLLNQNEISSIDNRIATINPLINQKNEKIKSLFVDQSLLRSQLATIISQNNAISTDCASISIDIENNSRRIKQEEINNHQKKLELSTIENEILLQSEKIKEMENKIFAKKEEIRKLQEKANNVCNDIQHIKIEIENIRLDSIIPTNKNSSEQILPNLNQLQNELDGLKNVNDQLLSERENLDERYKQLSNIIDKKSQMIKNDQEKIIKKQTRYDELQEIFKLRKIMLITAFDDANHKYDKLYCNVHKLEMQMKKKTYVDSEESSSNNIDLNENSEMDVDYLSNYSNFENLPKINKKNDHSENQQTAQKYSKLFPASNTSKRNAQSFKNHFYSPHFSKS